MSTHLSGGEMNISLLQDSATAELLQLLEKCNGSKAIIWDDTLVGLIGLIARYQLLKERDVEKMYHLKTGKIPVLQNVAHAIFIIRPIVEYMNIIANYIKKMEKEPGAAQKNYHIFFVPRKSLICERRLEELGVRGNFNSIEAFSCNLFPFDDDLVSMEMEMAFREYHLEEDPTCLYEVAQAIITLQNIYGIIPRVSGKGPCVQKVWDLVKKLSLEPKNKFSKQSKGSQISQLILIDRSVDLLTPMATQVTYEGLIDEIFGIKNTVVQFPADKFNQEEETNDIMIDKTTTVTLNSGDELYVELRDKVFTSVAPILYNKTKFISAQVASAQIVSTQAPKSTMVDEIKKIVEQMPFIMKIKQKLATHMSIAELIKNVTDTPEFLETLRVEQDMFFGDSDKVLPFIENAIAHKKPLFKVLKLICMQNFTNSGLKPKILEHYKREIFQTYGFQHLLTMGNLEKVGLLYHQGNSRQYSVLTKLMNLIVENSCDVPKDINFVHMIYAPLSVRLIQRLSREHETIPQDLLAMLPGPVLEVKQEMASSQKNRSASYNDNTRVVLVFFIGGCTFSEISALRFLSQQEDNNVEYVVATTKLINGDSFVSTLIEPL